MTDGLEASVHSWDLSTGVDGPGTRFVLFLSGCQLRCVYCQNPDTWSERDGAVESVDDVMSRILRYRAVFERTGGGVTISGGEPLLHPNLDDIIRHMRSRGIIAGMITNGYLLTVERIERLNRAGLEHLQISIDNAQPDAVSKKSLKVLDKKLQMLAEYAEFGVNINSVVGSGIAHPEDALTVANRAVALGFSSTIGIIHDGSGQLQPLNPHERGIFEETKQLGKKSFARFNAFQENIAHGRPNEWRCRAGARYLYICEDGLVHYCSQQRGYPGVSLFDYTREQMRHEFSAPKSCAPYCTVSCVQQVAMIDNWRAPQKPVSKSSGLPVVPHSP